MITELANQECIPCKGGVPPLQGLALETYRKKLENGWNIVLEHHLEKEFTFKNFKDALAFTNRVGEIAEANNHHPDIYLAWGKVRITLWTHKVNGLTESDFVLAAKIELASR